MLIIREEKSGMVRKGTFFQILELLNVVLSSSDVQRLTHGLEKGDRIPYLEAIRVLALSPST